MRAITLSCVATMPFATAQPPYERMWEDFKQTFGKTYNGETEEESRFQVFKTNVDHITAENDKGLSYTLGVNQFTDQTSEEFKQYLGYEMRSPWTSSQLPFLGTHYYHGERMEDSVDWVEKGAVGAVKDQGHCGSCWAFSARGALESAWAILTGDLIKMSEQQLVDCAKSAGNGCSGGNMGASFEFDQGNTVCSEETYPYQAADGSCRQGGCTPAIPVGGVTGYKQVAKSDEQALQSALQLGPVSVAVAAGGEFQSYKSGILTSCGTQLDHGIVAVGYGTDGGKSYWKVRNSWSTSWGEAGYGRLARGTGGAGMCGILTDASYPTVKPCDPKCCGTCDCTQEEVCSQEAPCCGTECCDTSKNTCCDGGGCAHQEEEELCCGAEGGNKKCDKAENCCGGTCCNKGAQCQAGDCCAAQFVCGDQCCGKGPFDKQCRSKTDPTKCTCVTTVTDTCCDSGVTCSIGTKCCGETCCGFGQRCQDGQCSHATSLVL